MRRDKLREPANEFFIRWGVFVVGLLVMSFGISLMIRAEAGSAPWDVFHIGLYNQFGLTIGTWSIIAGIAILAITAVLQHELPKAGAFLNMLLVGVFIDMYLFLPILHTPGHTFGKGLMLIAGILIMGYGIGLYIAADRGAGPRDSLMLVLTEKTGWKVQHIRLSMEIIVLFLGWMLKGPIFIGTLIFCLSIGAIVGFSLPQCRNLVDRLVERGGQSENIYKRKIRANDYDGLSKKAR
ncbi:YczE/YyaS/YitT family protein [Pseudalkalibacillus caeni]|uniref:YitT family protein n=1 Tax=Exobacillus caeni TaxID=2574798 RepID=A0A5R9F6S2_9BACL|nr:YitT family protein [Pseudalkalibacillus caeni]TLS39287.1 YitT family protein [Pseudalkalibacillus caeni]